MTDDGKTAGGCWIYTGVTVEGPDGKLVNKANCAQARRREGLPRRTAGASRGRPTAASSTTAPPPISQGKPWSEKKKLIWWDPEAPGAEARGRRASGSGLDVPDFNAFLAPDAKNGDKPFIMRADLVGALLRPAQRRAVPRALRAGGVADQEPALEAADQPGGEDLEGAGPEERPGAGGLARLPVRHHHVPAHRASPLGRHVALPADAGGAVPLALRGDQPRARRGARHRQRREDHGDRARAARCT